jgi:signal transduction histidine kinase/CheY-like chemotaxis protein
MRSIAGLREFGANDSAPGRVCTVGTVLYHEPGRFICLQDGNDTLLALSHDSTALQPGDRVELVGLPGREGGRLVLREAVYRRTGKADEPAPTDLLHPETPDAALDGRLVRLTGIVTGVRRQAAEAFVAIRSGQRIFEASFVAARFDPERCAEGSTVTLQGVYRAIYDEYRQPIDFTLRLRSRHDIAVLHAPPLWTVSRALTAAGVLCLLTAAVLGWLAVLRARVAKQTAQIRAQLAHQSRLEADLQKAQRIESLGLLAGGIAHDFNNLLTGILGNLGLAKLDETASAAVGDCLTEAEYAALRARDLTQRLMVFTKGSPSVRTVVRLPPLVRESATFVLHGASVRCEFDLPDDLWFANVDRVQIGQVVQNLAINAAQAMPLGGTLHLALANEIVAPGFRADLAPGRYIRLTATDGGGGIPAELLPKIFDPYFTTKKTGNGLGLATVYSIVRRHGGHIEAESAPGRGATFRVWLPAADVGQVPEEPGLDYVPALAGPAAPFAARVLMMDDDVVIRRTVAVALFRAGYEVTTTADGREAVEEFVTAEKQGRPYRLVLLDLTVPGGLGGREAMAAIRNLAPQVRSIVSTGYGNDPAFTAYRDHGFDAALAKPYELKELLALVGETLADGPQ